jgi:hypothetical protein
MARKVMHNYTMKNDLNGEYFIYKQFLVKMGIRKDSCIDGIVLITGEEEEDGLEWVGVTQTMKRHFESGLAVTNKKVEDVN